MSNVFDFNDADEQKEGGNSSPIPPESIVFVRMEIRQPSSDKQVDPNEMWITKAGNGSGNNFLDCEFTVLAPSFEGKRIWQNFVVMGSDKACKISRAFLRAVLEAARGIMPDDSSPQAVAARQVQSYADFNGMEFPVVVGIQKIKPGDQYINNDIKRVITPDKEDYAAVQTEGEILSDKPIPELPQAPAQTQRAGWGNNNQANTHQQPAQTQPAPQNTAAGMPSSPARKWGNK